MIVNLQELTGILTDSQIHFLDNDKFRKRNRGLKELSNFLFLINVKINVNYLNYFS